MARSLSTDLTYRSCNAAAFVVYEPDLVRLVGFKPISSNSTFLQLLGALRLISWCRYYSKAISLRLASLGGKLVTHGDESNAIDFGSCVLHAVQHAGNRGSSIARISQHCSRSSIIGLSVTARLPDNGQITQTMFVRIFFDLIVVEVQRAFAKAVRFR